MKKELEKNQRQRSMTLKLNKETLRLLESAQLRHVEGGGSNSYCWGTWACCQEN